MIGEDQVRDEVSEGNCAVTTRNEPLLILGKGAYNRAELLDVFFAGEGKYVVLAESVAMHSEAIPKASQIIIEFDCLIFRHGDQELVAIPHNSASQRIHA